jgi:hypothetical protein
MVLRAPKHHVVSLSAKTVCADFRSSVFPSSLHPITLHCQFFSGINIKNEASTRIEAIHQPHAQSAIMFPRRMTRTPKTILLGCCLAASLSASTNAFVLSPHDSTRAANPVFHAPLLVSSSLLASASPSSSHESVTVNRVYGAASLQLDPWESYALRRLETAYREAMDIKCPFFRRRASDVLDSIEQILRFLIIRHKSLDVLVLGPPVGWRCAGVVCDKEKHVPTAEVMERIRQDWCPHSHKGYYITGRLSTSLYRDDCFFDGPDPDMPVQGLRKYLNAASQLFETKSSVAELLDLEVDAATDLIVAHWRMKGVLQLPWKPKLPEWTGTTTYHRDADGLIYKHTETWDLSVAQAFLKTLWPVLASKIWADAPMDEEDEDDGEGCVVVD